MNLTFVWFRRATFFYLIIVVIFFKFHCLDEQIALIKIAIFTIFGHKKCYELQYLSESVLWADDMGARSQSEGQKCNNSDWVFSNRVLIFVFSLGMIGFEQMRKETSKYHNVFYEEKNVCNRGRARYQLDLARIKKFPVSEDFAAAVCVLPKNYDEKAYFNFIERWGTVCVLDL